MPMQPTIKPTQAAIEAALVPIAHKHLGFRNLETANWDRMDFKDVHVGCVKAALLEAYEAGFQAAKMAAQITTD